MRDVQVRVFLGIYGLKSRFRGVLSPVGRGVQRFHPNTISASSVVFALAAAVCLAYAPHVAWLYLVVPVLFFLRIAANALDGMVAQWTDRASARGELVNESTDRLNDLVIFAGLAVSDAVGPLLVGAALAVVLLVSYLGILPRAAGGRRLYNGPLGKADRMLYLGSAAVLSYVLPLLDRATPREVFDLTMLLFVVLGVLTLVNRTRAAWRDLGSVAPPRPGPVPAEEVVP